MRTLNELASHTTPIHDMRTRSQTASRQNSDVFAFAPFMEQMGQRPQGAVQNNAPGTTISLSTTIQPTASQSTFASPSNSHLRSQKPDFAAQSAGLESSVTFANSSVSTQSFTTVQGLLAANVAMPTGMSEAMSRTESKATQSTLKGTPVHGAPVSQAAQTAQTGQTTQANNIATQSSTVQTAPQGLDVPKAQTPINLRKEDTYVQATIPLYKQGIALQKRSIALTGQRGIALDPTSLRRLETLATNTEKAALLAQNEKAALLAQKAQQDTSIEKLGHLAARFESGTKGIATIGYDRNGGTSYGTYQIASEPGSMDRFIKFLETVAPDMAKPLKEAGAANTGSRQGAMPEAWRALAKEDPARLESLQKQFIHNTHYLPALHAVEKRGYAVEDFSDAMKEVLWSTSVQHGPNGAARIFGKAAEIVGLVPAKQKEQEPALINQIYAIRSGQFHSSTKEVQSAVRQRMTEEKLVALNLHNANSLA